jgi:hypothetical protein
MARKELKTEEEINQFIDQLVSEIQIEVDETHKPSARTVSIPFMLSNPKIRKLVEDYQTHKIGDFQFSTLLNKELDEAKVRLRSTLMQQAANGKAGDDMFEKASATLSAKSEIPTHPGHLEKSRL